MALSNKAAAKSPSPPHRAGAPLSTFTCRASRPARRGGILPLLPARGGGHETVLLVEDEELVRMMLVEVLKSGGYKVLDARHGADALALGEQYHRAD
jgi:PleD family two-component response regulator